MERKKLALLLKGLVVMVILIGALFYIVLIPEILKGMADEFPEFSALVTPFTAAIALSAFPIAFALVNFWGILSEIAKDNSFCGENVKRLSNIAVCAFIDTAYCLIGTTALFILKAANGGVLVLSIIIMLVGTGITVAASLLSHLVEKVRLMQQDVELTI